MLLFCVRTKTFYSDPEKTKILVFEIPSHKKQKTDDSPEQSVPWNFKN